MGITVETDISCCCEDWERHQASNQSTKELEARRKRAISVDVVSMKVKGGLLIAKTLTRDRSDARLHEVIMPASTNGNKAIWRCKHILAVEGAYNQ